MNRLAGQPLPLSAAGYWGGVLRLRLSGTASGVTAARARTGGDLLDEGLWTALREQRLPFFAGEAPLWRLSVPPACAPLPVPGEWLLDWGGAQRWLRTPADPATVREVTAGAGGSATLFRGGDGTTSAFHPLPEPLAALHRRLKTAFDPEGILNPGRLYPDL
jgi:glycolate oxidase FAD binding subunit